MIQKFYEKTKGYKTLAGFIIAFVAGGLAYTNVIDAEMAKDIEFVGAYIIAFGIGDKVASKMK